MRGACGERAGGTGGGRAAKPLEESAIVPPDSAGVQKFPAPAQPPSAPPVPASVPGMSEQAAGCLKTAVNA